MITPEDIYIAECLAEFPSRAAGIDHEKRCPECRRKEASRRVVFPDDWYEDSANIAALLRWLRDSDEGIDLDAAIAVVESPSDWTDEYRMMLADREIA